MVLCIFIGTNLEGGTTEVTVPPILFCLKKKLYYVIIFFSLKYLFFANFIQYYVLTFF